MSTTGKNYEDICRALQLEAVPEYYNFGFDAVDVWAKDPGRLALFWRADDKSEKRLTFSEVSASSSAFAKGLLAKGLRKGDRCLVILGRTPDWQIAVVGMLKAGIVAVPATTLLTSKDILYRVKAAGCKAVLVDQEIAPRIEAIRNQIVEASLLISTGVAKAPWICYDEILSAGNDAGSLPLTRSSDEALIYFSSGTTGAPKMVLHTQASYPLGHQVTGKYWLDLKPDDLHWNLSDPGWAKAAWSSLFGPWGQGAAIFLAQMSGKFEPGAVLNVLQKYPITTFCAPPTAYRLLVQEDLRNYRFERLRHCVSAGEPLNPEVIDSWKAATGLTIYDGYGQTETVLLVGNFPGLPVKPGSMGKPAPGFEVGIVDEDGHEVPVGREGDIAVRVSPRRPIGIFREYLSAPELNQSVRRNDWYITGDRAIRDADGYLWFVGRADDVIITAGYRVGPFEVESALVEHAAVVEAAAVAKPDPIRGSIIKAFVVLAPGYSASEDLAVELQDYVKKTTAAYKYPREIEFAKELPKTISGKILRRELRQRELATNSQVSTASS